MRFFKDVQRASQQVAQGEVDMAAIKAVMNVVGVVAHLPTGQMSNTLEGIYAIEQGDVEGIGILQALAAGPPR
jgi:hypothetical protein